MNVLNWIPQVKSTYMSLEIKSRIKPRLLTTLKLNYISTKENKFKRMVIYFRILEPVSLNIVNQYMNDKGISETNLPFWYTVNDNGFKVSSQNCNCYVKM